MESRKKEIQTEGYLNKLIKLCKKNKGNFNEGFLDYILLVVFWFVFALFSWNRVSYNLVILGSKLLSNQPGLRFLILLLLWDMPLLKAWFIGFLKATASNTSTPTLSVKLPFLLYSWTTVTIRETEEQIQTHGNWTTHNWMKNESR